MKILLVEDDPALGAGLKDLLRVAGYEVDLVADGHAAARRGVDPAVDLIVLDLMLPGIDGFEVCHRVRKTRPAVPILLLTARGAEEDKVRGLKNGADDYVTKPFGARELLARVEALKRRAEREPDEADVIVADGCTLDLGRCTARRGRKRVTLTAREAGILRWLHLHRARAVSRAELLEHVWGVSASMETRTVDVTISNLRQKIERDAATPRVIVSVKGVGYAWGAA
jgi:DNA-binding response OmpR family regulator